MPTSAFRSNITLCIISAGLLLHLTGCVGALVRGVNPDQQALLDTPVKEIEAVELEKLSETPPVTVEEAAENYLHEILDAKPKESVNLSLEEVRAAALTQNLDLKVQVFEPSLAEEAVNVERAKFEAVLRGDIQYALSNTPTSSELQGSQTASTTYNLGLLQPLPTGGEIGIGLPGGRFETDNEYSTLNPAFDTDLRFSISQPLLRGAGIETNTHSIRVAKFQKKIADARTKLEAIRILALADKAYWTVYGASRELEIRNQQYELALRQLNEARLRVKAGAAPRVEITRAESGVAARLEAILVSLTQVRLNQRNLKRLMNRADLPVDATAPLNLVTPPRPLGLSLNAGTLSEQAVANRMEMLETELQLAVDESTIKYAKNLRLPLFVFDYSYNLNGLGASFGRAYKQLGEGDFTDWTVGLRAQIPLGNQAAESRLNQAILQRAQRLATKDLRRQAIEKEVFDVVDMLEQNWQRILAARQEVVFAARTYEAERRQFELNVRTSTDVLDAAARLAEAQSREINALIDYQNSQVDIAFATGTLLGHANVVWDPAEWALLPAEDGTPQASF